MVAMTPIFLFAEPRSGTHLLRGILCSGPDVEDLSEVFNLHIDQKQPQNFFPFFEDRVRRSPEFLRPVRELRAQVFDEYMEFLGTMTKRPFGLVSVPYNQTQHLNLAWQYPDDIPNLLRLVKTRHYPVVHLVRRNLLERYCSLKLAMVTKKWVSRSTNPDKDVQIEPIHLDVEKLVNDLAKAQMRINFFEWCLDDHDRLLPLTYEDILVGGGLNHGIYDKLCTLLGAKITVGSEPTTRKMAPPLRQLVANYDEVVRTLAGTPFAGLAL